jgi:hypothetical protein
MVFGADVLALTLPSEISVDYFTFIYAISDRAAGGRWTGLKTDSGLVVVNSNHITTTETRAFLNGGVGINSISANSSAVCGFSLNLSGTDHTAWGSTNGLSTYAYPVPYSTLRTMYVGAHDNTGAAGAAGTKLGALWIFAGAEIDLAAACTKMVGLYPEVAL